MAKRARKGQPAGGRFGGPGSGSRGCSGRGWPGGRPVSSLRTCFKGESVSPAEGVGAQERNKDRPADERGEDADGEAAGLEADGADGGISADHEGGARERGPDDQRAVSRAGEQPD